MTMKKENREKERQMCIDTLKHYIFTTTPVIHVSRRLKKDRQTNTKEIKKNHQTSQNNKKTDKPKTKHHDT